MTIQHTGLQKRRLTWYLGLTQQILSSCPCAQMSMCSTRTTKIHFRVWPVPPMHSTQSPYNNMLGKTASEFGEDTTSMVNWVRNFPWDSVSTASTRAFLNTFNPLPITNYPFANYLIAYPNYTDTKDMTLSDVGGGTCSINFLDTHERLLSVSGTHLLRTCPSNNNITSLQAFKCNE